MRVFIFGGSGLLGSHAAVEALSRGHEVSILSRSGGAGPGGCRALRGDLATMGDRELERALDGQDAVIYALGLDDRADLPRPAYPVLRDDHVDRCARALRAAKRSGASRFAVFGSYFTHFDRERPELGLAQRHPYVRSRKEQLEAVLAESGGGFESYVLEIPYVIGSMPGRVPPWSFLFNMLSPRGKRALFFARGGTAAVTARQVGRAAVGAIEGAPAGAYPLGGENFTWPELAQRFWSLRGAVDMRLAPLPESLFAAFGSLSALYLAARGRERGLEIRRFASFQYSEAYVDPGIAMGALGYVHDDYQAALAAMVKEWAALRA